MKDLTNQITALFEKWSGACCPGGQVMIRRGKEVIYDRCFGMANLEHRIPVTPETVFHIASVSKQVTVLSVLLLMEDGKLRVTDDIRKYIGDLIHFDEPMTVLNLMNNVSGIRDQWELLMLRGILISDTITMEDLKTTLRLQKSLHFAPGTEYLYSNSNFTLLAEIVERVSGMALPQFAAKRIFGPLGMLRTVIRSSTAQIIPNMASSYLDEGAGSYCCQPLNYNLYGATSMVTCASDLVKLLDDYEYPAVCRGMARDTMMHRPRLADGSLSEYGAGLMLGTYGGHPYYEHGGVDAGYRAHMICFPEDKLDIIILSNTSNAVLARTARAIAGLLLGLPLPAMPDVPCDKSMLKPGVYAGNRDYLPVCIVIREDPDGKLALKGEHAFIPLTRTANGRYQVGDTNDFLSPSDGKLYYISAGKAANLSPVTEVKAELAKGLSGTYFDPESDSILRICETETGLAVSHTRYPLAPLYDLGDGRMIFDLGGDLPAILTGRGDGDEGPGNGSKKCPGFTLDCSRARKMRYHRIADKL